MAVKEKLKAFDVHRAKDDSLASYRETLAGGDAAAGKKVFVERADLSCVRCHKIKGEGGIVGPNLSSIGLHDRTYILESVVDPNKVIAPGFESISAKVKGGKIYTGMARADEAKLFRFTIRHSLLLATVIALIVMFYAYAAPELAPQL